jgi:excisionase family DNA binding protein
MGTTEEAYGDTTTLPGLLAPQEVAELLGVSRRQVSRLAHEGVIEGVKLGHRTVRFTRRSVLTLIDPDNEQRPMSDLIDAGIAAGNLTNERTT